MAASKRLARYCVALLVGCVVVPAQAAYTAQYAGSASSTAGAGADQYFAPYDRVGDYPEAQRLSAPNSSLPVNGSTILGAVAGGGSSFSSSSFTATGGGLHVSAVASASASPATGWSGGSSSESYAEAVAYDSFIISAPGYAPGDVFTVFARVNLTGSVGAKAAQGSPDSGSYDALASWHAEVSLHNSTMMFPMFERASSSCWDNKSVGMGCGGDGLAPISLSFTVANGAATDFLLQGQTRARAVAGAEQGATVGADAWANLGHTIAWGGISSLVDQQGNAIQLYTAASASSGFDYRSAYVSSVPEPRAWMLFLLGFLGVAYTGRRTILHPELRMSR